MTLFVQVFNSPHCIGLYLYCWLVGLYCTALYLYCWLVGLYSTLRPLKPALTTRSAPVSPSSLAAASSLLGPDLSDAASSSMLQLLSRLDLPDRGLHRLEFLAQGMYISKLKTFRAKLVRSISYSEHYNLN